MPPRNRQRKGSKVADSTDVYLTAVLPGAVDHDLKEAPQDLGEVMAKMITQEAMVRNTSKIAEGLARDRYLDVVLEIGAKVEERSEVPQVVTYTAVIEYYVNAASGDRTRDALRVFKHMSVSGVTPNAYTYAIIIKALAAAHTKNPDFNYIDYAKGYFVKMLENGMQPNEETFSALLEGIGSNEEERRVFVKLVKEKEFLQLKEDDAAREEARDSQLNTEMEKLKEHVMMVFKDATKVCEDKDSQGKLKEIGENYDLLCKYAFGLYNTLIRRGLKEEAKELFKPLLETGVLPIEAVFIIVIFVSCTSGKNKGTALMADQHWQHMLSCGITPSACTYNLFIALLATDPDFVAYAKKYVRDIKVEGLKPFLRTNKCCFNGIALRLPLVLACVIEAYTNSGEAKGALQTYLDMLATGFAPNSYTYSVLIKGLAADPNFFGDAKKCLLKMLDKRMKPNAVAYTAVLEGFARQDNVAAEEESEEFLEVMKARGFVPDAEAVQDLLQDRQAPLSSWIMNILSKLEQ